MTAVTVTRISNCPSKRRRRLDPITYDLSARLSRRVNLQALPAELLYIILSFSLEASLILVSRAMFAKLPSFIVFTRTLAFQALLPLKQMKEFGATVCPGGPEIAHQLDSLDSETQDIIRQKLSATSWFNEDQVNHVRRKMLDWIIFCNIRSVLTAPPSRRRVNKIRDFLNERMPIARMQLNLRGENRRLVYLKATSFAVEVSDKGNDWVSNLQVLDFGGVIPDFLLRYPMTSAKQATISIICNQKAARNGEIKYNRELLARSILDSISRSLSVCDELLRLAASTTVMLDIFKHIVVSGQWHGLIWLLKQTWRLDPGQYSLSDRQLIRLIDEARSNRYPNSNETTIVLAMEAAALWKMAEVRSAGGRAARVYTQWPPQLVIQMPRRKDVYWYIPR